MKDFVDVGMYFTIGVLITALSKAYVSGDIVQILNIGGVLGICDSANPEVGAPFDCEVLGTVLLTR